MWRADGSYHPARARDGERRAHGLAGPDTLERSVDTEAISHVAHGLDCRLAALRDDVRCAEFASDGLTRRVPR